MSKKRRPAPPRPAGRAREARGDQVLFVRVPKELIRRLDEHLAAERARTGYRTLARSDVVRKLLDQALEATRRREG